MLRYRLLSFDAATRRALRARTLIYRVLRRDTDASCPALPDFTSSPYLHRAYYTAPRPPFHRRALPYFSSASMRYARLCYASARQIATPTRHHCSRCSTTSCYTMPLCLSRCLPRRLRVVRLPLAVTCVYRFPPQRHCRTSAAATC